MHHPTKTMAKTGLRRWALARRLFGAAAFLGYCLAADATVLTVGLLGLEGDARYLPRRLEKAYPGHPAGRPLEAAQLAVEETTPALESVGRRLQIKSFWAGSRADLPKVYAQMKTAKVQYLLLDLPQSEFAAALPAATQALGPVLMFNIGAASDELRGGACAEQLLHTYPSQAMLSDALAQYLASRNWGQLLLLHGPLAQDKPQVEALARSAKRYGMKLTKTVPFKLSADPREREMGNVRLLTSDKGYDVVAVVDSDGEFARSVPYSIQLPRPVVGANGLTALAWHPQWDANGGPQLSRRFQRAAHRPMSGQDWAAWAAVKAIASVVEERPQGSAAEQLRLLRSGQVFIDGFKGPRLSFRSWDGQLRQPVFLAHADGVIATAPLDGVLHPTEVLDTLGVDEKESVCKKRL